MLADQAAVADRRGAARHSARWLRRVGYALGLALLVVAVGAVVSDTDRLRQAWLAARSAPAWQVALLLALPILNWLLTAAFFQVLTARYGRVRPLEMVALIGSAWLLNYAPVKAGIVGRVAYQKVVCGIAVKDSLKVLIHAEVIALVGSAALLGVLVEAFGAGLPVVPPRGAGAALAVGSVLALAAACATPLPWGRRWGALRVGDRLRRAALCLALRVVDMVVWTVRYMLAFAIIGEPLNPLQAAVIATVSQLIALLPVQLGVREWSVGLLRAFLPGVGGPSTPPATAGQAVAAMTPGLLADVLNRVAELLVAVPVGLLCAAYLARRVASTRSEHDHGSAAPAATSADVP